MSALDLLWLVPALPFAGFLVNGLLVRNAQKPLVTAVGVGFPGLSLLVALAAIVEYLGSVRPAAFVSVVLYVMPFLRVTHIYRAKMMIILKAKDR